MATRKSKPRKPPTPHRAPADQDAATELVLYIENTSDLSPDGPSGQGRSVLLNALRKWRRGTYDPTMAVRLFEYLTESGAKRYAKEMGSSEKEWSTMFTPATRHEAAKQLEASFRHAVEHGEYDHVDTKIGVREGVEAHRPERSMTYPPSPSGQYVLSRDGKEVMRGTEQEIWQWMHRNHSYSIDHALRYEGYSITPAEGAQRGESFTPALSGQYVGRRVEILHAPGSVYFKPGQFGYVVGQNQTGGMHFIDVKRTSRPGEVALLISKTREMRGGALWFSLEGVRFTGRDTRGHEARESVSERRDRYSMTYGQLPEFKNFEHDVHTRINPETDEPYWPEGTTYPMELVSPREIELAREFGGLDDFRTERHRTGRHTGAIGFRGNEKQIYDFLTFLVDQEDAFSGEEDSAGSLASSIMYTLGYEWV